MKRFDEGGRNMTQEELWRMAYVKGCYFLNEGLDRMKAAGYTIEYDEETKRFTCIPPKENNRKES